METLHLLSRNCPLLLPSVRSQQNARVRTTDIDSDNQLGKRLELPSPSPFKHFLRKPLLNSLKQDPEPESLCYWLTVITHTNDTHITASLSAKLHIPRCMHQPYLLFLGWCIRSCRLCSTWSYVCRILSQLTLYFPFISPAPVSTPAYAEQHAMFIELVYQDIHSIFENMNPSYCHFPQQAKTANDTTGWLIS